jgi:hypothetical protein
MNKFRFTLSTLAIAIFTLAFASMAQAQATRTWVSGVGDDVNPCSRTAPCKTFAGAISKTAINGEIDALDPGGYGTVTITKGITIDGGATFASVLGTGTTAGMIVNISAPAANDLQKVIIRRISFNGSGGINGAAGGGQRGVRILAAKSVSIEDCYIFGFTGGVALGIADERTAANSLLNVVRTDIENNGSHGILVAPAAGNSGVKAIIDHVVSSNNGGIGISISHGANAAISNCVTSGNTANAGLEADNGSAVDIENCVTSNNSTGLLIQGGTFARISNLNVMQNSTGINNNGVIRSFGNNKVDSNGTNLVGNAIQGPGTGGPSQL